MDLDTKHLGRKPRPNLGSLWIEISKILTCFIDGHYNISCYNYIAQYRPIPSAKFPLFQLILFTGNS